MRRRICRSAIRRVSISSVLTALNFPRRYGIPEVFGETVWDAIALHTTPRIPEQKPEVALVTSEPDPAKSVLHQNSVVPEQAETQGFKYSNGSPGPPFSRGDNNLLRLAATFWVRDL